MRYLNLLASLAVVACIPVMANAQTSSGGRTTPAPTIEGPEYDGIVEAVAGGRRIALERAQPEIRASTRALGLGGVATYQQVQGEHSPIRFPRGSDIEFVTRAPSQNMEPSSYVHLFQLSTRHGARRLNMGGANMFGGSFHTENEVALAGDRYGPSFYRLHPLVRLPPGEYLVQSGGSQIAFLFGVD